MKTLVIHGLKVNYSVSPTGELLIGFFLTTPLPAEKVQQLVETVGRYLIAEGFVKDPLDGAVNA